MNYSSSLILSSILLLIASISNYTRDREYKYYKKLSSRLITKFDDPLGRLVAYKLARIT